MDRRPNLKRKNDTMLNYIMIALIVILILCFIVYVCSLEWTISSLKSMTFSFVSVLWCVCGISDFSTRIFIIFQRNIKFSKSTQCSYFLKCKHTLCITPQVL